MTKQLQKVGIFMVDENTLKAPPKIRSRQCMFVLYPESQQSIIEYCQNNLPCAWALHDKDIYSHDSKDGTYKKGDLKKQNYDACDALICALAYINVNHYGIEKPTIVNVSKKEDENQITINYTTKIWGKTFDKMLVLNKNS